MEKKIESSMYTLIQAMIDNDIIGLYLNGLPGVVGSQTIIWGSRIEPAIIQGGIIVRTEYTKSLDIDSKMSSIHCESTILSSNELKYKLSKDNDTLSFIMEDNGHVSIVSLDDVKYRYCYYQWKDFMNVDEL